MQPTDKVIQATCPNCQKPLRVPESLLGQTIRCKSCSHTFEIHTRPPAALNDPTRPTPPLPATARPPLPATARRPSAPTVEPLGTATGFEDPTPLPPRLARPPAQPLPAVTPSGGFTSAFGARSKHKGGAYKPGRGKYTTWLMLGFGGLALAGLIGAAVYFAGMNEPTDTDVAENPGDGSGTSATPGSTAAPKGPYPRRLLAISVNNYIFANPVSYGDSKPELERDRHDVHAVVRKIATQWKIPADQVYELTDGAAQESAADTDVEPTKKEPIATKPVPKVKGKAPLTFKSETPKNQPKFSPKGPVRQAKANDRPPFRGVIEKTVDLFLDGCREQDRIIVLFTGHALEKDGKAYLVPLEGDMDEVKTLIPLEPIYKKLGQCKAQQKIVVFDICRVDPYRGAERPTVGPMSEELEKILHSPPAGVAVWTSCSKEQQAFEEDYGAAANSEFWGSLFLSQYLNAAGKGMYSKNGKAGGLSTPEDPFPIDSFSQWVTERTSVVSRENYKTQQTPKFTPASATKNVAWNPAEKPPARFEIPVPPQGVPRDQIAAIFKEINLPPRKKADASAPVSSADATFPFPVEAMADYLKDDVTAADVRANPKQYAVRLAVMEATDTIRKLGAQADADLPQTIGKTQATTDGFKKEILEKQTVPAEQQAELREAFKMMEDAAKEMDKEKSKRWLASFDFVYAQIKIRIAYLEEYNLVMGKIRKDELPALDDKQTGWQLSSQEKMNCSPEFRALAAEGKEKLEEIIKSHPNTPWAMLAKREKNSRLGLTWQPRTSE